MTLPLTDRLNHLLNKQPISMHVPGHKNMTIGYLNELKMEMDMTEITGLDDLHQAEDVIGQSMQHINKHPDYDAYFLVNGTTSGILAVIQSFAKVKGEYIIARNVHKSVFHALDLARASSKLLKTSISSKTKQYVGPDEVSLKTQVDKAKLAVFTYPNYYGECFDVASTMKYMKACQIPTLIDEAHGAHFNLMGFPNSTVNMGADYVVQSYHKTLPSLTMSSIIFIHKKAPLREDILKYLTYFQSSSPSYLLMSSLELAHDFYKSYDSSLFFEKRSQLIKVLKDKGMRIIDVEDPLKLNIQCNGYTGIELQTLFENQEIYVELADDYQVLLVLPLWHKGDQFPFDDLLARISAINIETRVAFEVTDVPFYNEEGTYDYREIDKVKKIDIDKAYNKILATHLTPYPPGIPIMLRGEIITKNMIKLMNYWCNHQIRVEGMKDNKIEIKDE